MTGDIHFKYLMALLTEAIELDSLPSNLPPIPGVTDFVFAFLNVPGSLQRRRKILSTYKRLLERDFKSHIERRPRRPWEPIPLAVFAQQQLGRRGRPAEPYTIRAQNLIRELASRGLSQQDILVEVKSQFGYCSNPSQLVRRTLKKITN
jgi:hypothetical protein